VFRIINCKLHLIAINHFSIFVWMSTDVNLRSPLFSKDRFHAYSLNMLTLAVHSYICFLLITLKVKRIRIANNKYIYTVSEFAKQWTTKPFYHHQRTVLFQNWESTSKEIRISLRTVALDDGMKPDIQHLHLTISRKVSTLSQKNQFFLS